MRTNLAVKHAFCGAQINDTLGTSSACKNNTFGPGYFYVNEITKILEKTHITALKENFI